MKEKHHMKWVKLISIAVMITAFAVCFPRSAFLKTFRSTYSPKGALKSASCNICHTSKAGGKLNSYGAAVKKAMGSAKAPTGATLRKVERIDSYGKRIKAGKLPAGG
jgi:hypothetical protein